jgi:acyl-CoA ligase (AMP-forming) (exosortase A-associated)
LQLEEFLEASARCFPDKTALICGRVRLTYREVEAKSNAIAHGLVAAGVQRGDRVAVFLENSPEAVLAIFGILKAGAVFLVVNPSTKADKLAYILNNCQATALITAAPKLATIEPCLAQTPHLRKIFVGGAPEAWPSKRLSHWHSLDDLLRESSRHRSAPTKRCIDVDLAALVYTSGSTGKPKGVMLTHLNIVSAATSITTYLRNTSNDVILSVLPLSFDYGLYQILMAFKVGATVILERSFAYPHAVLQAAVRERITGLPIVPTVSAILLQMDLTKYDLSSLRYITNTGAALPTEHIRKLRQLLPHVQLFSMYGLTECKRISYLPPDQIDFRPESVGKAMPNVETYIVDEHGHRVGPSVVGELVVRGSNVMKGYWGLPEETERMLRPGPLPGERVLFTGDLFWQDEEGYLYFVGRKDDIIKTRGEKVSPKEVEDVLYRLEGVVEASVFGVPDRVLGQAVKAVVSRSTGSQLTEQDVLAHCAKHLEDFMVPQFVEFRDHLPKTASGKINRRELALSAERDS